MSRIFLLIVYCLVHCLTLIEAATVQCGDGQFYDNFYGVCIDPVTNPSFFCAGQHYEPTTGAICAKNTDGSEKAPVCPVSLIGSQIPGSFPIPYGTAGNSNFAGPSRSTAFFRNTVQYSQRFRCTTPNAESPIRQERLGQYPSELDTTIYAFADEFGTTSNPLLRPTAQDGSNQPIKFDEAFALRVSSAADARRVIDAGVDSQAGIAYSTVPEKKVLSVYFTHPDIYEGNCWVPFDLVYVDKVMGGNTRVFLYTYAKFRVIYSMAYLFSPFAGANYPVFCDPSMYSNPSGDFRTWIPLPISPTVCSLDCNKRGNQRCNTAGNGCECIDGLFPVFDGDGFNIVACKKLALLPYDVIGLDQTYLNTAYNLQYASRKGLCIGGVENDAFSFCRRYAGAYFTG